MATSGASHYYYYEDKKVELGPVLTDMVIIGFMEGVNHETKLQVIGEFDFLDKIMDETNSGSADITVVSTKGELTPGTMELKLNLLEQHPKVLYAGPIFPPNTNSTGRLGITNQFIVHLDDERNMLLLEQLMRRTHTRIVEEIGPGIYILSADKNAAGNSLDMANYFHENPGVKIGEPDFFQHLLAGNLQASK